MNTPLVSVVTPVYNTGEYLDEAIRSVLAQSYSNIEYIICNNHSTDASGEIAARYSALDSRVRVIQPPRFLPQAENFNFALQHISPESRYCKMLLADDWMFPRCLEEMVACAELSPDVGLVSAYRLIETEGDGFGLPADKRIVPGRVAGRLHMLGGVYLFGTPSTVMYASDVVRSRAPHFFPEDRFYFDTDAAFQILADRDLAFVHQILTFSRYQPGSITHNVSTFHSRAVDRLLSLHHYGRIFLNAEEYERAISRAWRVYYESLGQQWLRERFSGRSEKYWDFHNKRLAGIGMKIEPKRLALGAGTSFLRALTSSGDLLRDFVVKRRPVEEPWKVHSPD